MSQKNTKFFIDEVYSKGPKKSYSTNKTDVYHIDDIWSLVILDLKDYGPENKKSYGCVLVVIDNFLKFGCTTPRKNKNAQTIKHSLENVLIISKRKTNLIESDRSKEVYNSIFQKFINNKNIKHFSRKTSIGVVLAERFIRIIGNLLKRVVFENVDADWVNILLSLTKQYNIRIHSSNMLTPIQASVKKMKVMFTIIH